MPTVRTNPFYLVIAEGRNGRPTAKRVTQSWPALAPGETAVRLALDFPNDLLFRPSIVIEIPEEAESVGAVAAPLEPPEAEST